MRALRRCQLVRLLWMVCSGYLLFGKILVISTWIGRTLIYTVQPVHDLARTRRISYFRGVIDTAKLQ